MNVEQQDENSSQRDARVNPGLPGLLHRNGARLAGHIHPLGQMLIVTAGKGWTQCEGGPIVELNPGDIVSCPPNHRHWHGATPTTAMTHIALQESLDGKVVEWMEHVRDEDYDVGSPTGA